MEKYESYKDSSIEWIGNIPSHWETTRLRFLYTFRSGMGNKKPEDFGEGFPFLTYKDVYSNDQVVEPTGLVKSTNEDREKYSIHRGDVFFTGSSETIEELGYSTVCLSDISNATFNGFTIRARPNGNEIIPEFAKYLYRSNIVRSYLIQRDNSITRANLSQQTLGDLIILLPPIYEQNRIAAYLDQKTAEIDKLIEETEKSIELLEEYRNAVISEAVTKGLDPDVPMKDSGIDWIGEIPEHWEKARIKDFAMLITGHTPPSERTDFFGGEVLWFTPGDLNNSIVTHSERTITSEAIEERVSPLYPKDTTLIVGIGATAGKVGYSEIECSSNQQITSIHSEIINNKYLFYWLMAFEDVIRKLALYTTLPILNNSFLGSLLVFMPSIEEQRNIVRYLDERISEFESNMNDKRELIKLLKDYRKSLISEAVTGKFKVPGVE